MEDPGGRPRGWGPGGRAGPGRVVPGRWGKRPDRSPRIRRRAPPIPWSAGPLWWAGLGSGRSASSSGAVGSMDHAHATPEGTAHPRVPTRLLRDACESVARPARPARGNLPSRVLETPAERGKKDPRNRRRLAALIPAAHVMPDGLHSFRASFAFGRSSLLPHFRQRVARIAFRA